MVSIEISQTMFFLSKSLYKYVLHLDIVHWLPIFKKTIFILVVIFWNIIGGTSVIQNSLFEKRKKMKLSIYLDFFGFTTEKKLAQLRVDVS